MKFSASSAAAMIAHGREFLPLELSRMEETLRARIVDDLLASGVIVHAPGAVRVGPWRR